MSSPYNGFSPSERNSSSPIQYRAIKAGVLKPGSEGCEMCHRKNGYLCPHLEDYERVVSDAHHLCIYCHMTLHCRFWRPNTWRRLVWHLSYEKGFQPPYYQHGGLYYSGIKQRPDHEFYDLVREEDKKHWWQFLRLDPIDFRELQAAGDPHCEEITHPPNPEIDLVYNLKDGNEVHTESPSFLKAEMKKARDRLQKEFNWDESGH